MLLAVPILPVKAQVVTLGVVKQQYRFVETAYLPLVIQIKFDFTQNYTKSEVTTLGMSLWYLSISPQSASFSTNDTDSFTFSISIAYPRPRNSTIIIGVFSQGRVISERDIDFNAQIVTLKFEVRTEKAPHYPTSEELAAALVTAIRGELAGWTDAITRGYEAITNNLSAIEGLTAVSFLVSIILIVFIFIITRGGRIGRR